MSVYFSKTYTASAHGSAIKEVTCEKCGTRFFYQIFRYGTGQGESPYLVRNEAASEASKKRALASLAARLNVELEAVPCPKCGHIQQQMASYFRRRAYSGLRTFAWIAPIVALIITGCFAFIDWINRARTSHEPWTRHYIAAAGCLCLTPLLLLLRRRLLARGNWLKDAIARSPVPMRPEDLPPAPASIS